MPPSPRRISDAGIEFIKQCEGCKLEAYLDSAGIPTIGVGHTLGVEMGQRISQEMADELLRADLAKAEDAVARMVDVPLTDNQHAALVSFVFNIGQGAFANSTLRRVLNEGHYGSVAAQLTRWDKIRGVVSQGLRNRRIAEAELWSS